jgi:hypothetical protein
MRGKAGTLNQTQRCVGMTALLLPVPPPPATTLPVPPQTGCLPFIFHRTHNVIGAVLPPQGPLLLTFPPGR